METLIFFLTILTLLVLVCTIFIKTIKGKPVMPAFKKLLLVGAGYFILWVIFYFKSSFVVVPLGTDVCFDDWCATITRVEAGSVLQKQFSAISTDSTWIIVDVRMSNHARGITQKPSEPRIHIIGQNSSYAYSARGQQLLQKTSGSLPGIGDRLELHQSLDTKIVFAVQANARDLKILIEEGPAITGLLFHEDQMVFAIR